MAEGFDPDEADRRKNILQWIKDVQMASQQVPQVPDRGLSSNPAQTSYTHDPIRVATDIEQAPLPDAKPHPSMYMYNPPELSHPHHRIPTTRTASLSLSSRPHLTLSSLFRVPPSLPSIRRTRGPPMNIETATSALSSLAPVSGSPVASEEMPIHLEKCSELQQVSDVMSGEEQRKQELKSLARMRQSSLSPLPVPTTMQQALPTFDPSNIGRFAPRHRWIAKRPTVSGLRDWKVPPAPPSRLLRASTSPGELPAARPKSAPSSPKLGVHRKASPSVAIGGDDQEREVIGDLLRGKFPLSGAMKRRKSSSHDDIHQLEQFSQLQLGTGGVSPAVSYDSFSGNVPSNQQSLIAEGGSSQGEGKSSDLAGELESFSSDEAPKRDDFEGLHSHHSVSPDGDNSDPSNQACHYYPQPGSQPYQEDQKKVQPAVALYPISPPFVTSPRTSRSPFTRQRPVTRSPSPSHTHTSPTSPPRKSLPSTSSSGPAEPEKAISKRKLRLLNESQTFSFDTSDDSDFSKVSKQPKFLLKKTHPSVSTCPISPPPSSSLLSPPSPQHRPGTLSRYLTHHRHSFSDSLTSPTLPTQLSSGPSQPHADYSNKSLRPRSPVLSEQLLLRRGSSPITHSLKQTSQVGPSSVQSTGLAKSLTLPLRPLVTTASPPALGIMKHQAVETKESLSRNVQEGHPIGSVKKLHGQSDSRQTQMGFQSETEKDAVNRQDSGIDTLSATSHRYDFRI